MKLHKQLLSTAAGLVRQDCNYYNIDKIKAECTWNQDTEEWNLPRVMITKTTLSPVSSHQSVQRKSSSTSTLPSTATSLGPKMTGSSPLTSSRSYHDSSKETEGLERMGNGGELEYFKPKRALELLAEGAQLRGTVASGQTILTGETSLSWKRGRLQSLPPQSHHPGPHTVLQHGSGTHHNVLETVEWKKNKWHSLEPLGDPHRRHPPP